MPESEKNRACWNCWYDEFCDWHPAGDEDACEEFVPEEEEFTDPGDVVIDPCCGSGSTLRAAVESGRSAYGFEIDRNFYERAKNEMLMFERDEQMTIEDFPEVMP